jgi:F-type H+-transporting ATPase subunit delta
MAERATLARPYAKAIFEIASHDQNYDNWSNVLNLLSLMMLDPQMLPLIKDKTVSPQVIMDLIVSIAGPYLDETSQNFVRLLITNRRLIILPEIAFLYEQFRSDAENSVDVEFFTPVPVPTQEEEKFEKILEKYLSKKVHLIYKIDEQLLGGFVARAGNYVIDGSLKSRLANLKQAMGG